MSIWDDYQATFDDYDIDKIRKAWKAIGFFKFSEKRVVAQIAMLTKHQGTLLIGSTEEAHGNLPEPPSTNEPINDVL